MNEVEWDVTAGLGLSRRCFCPFLLPPPPATTSAGVCPGLPAGLGQRVPWAPRRLPHDFRMEGQGRSGLRGGE